MLYIIAITDYFELEQYTLALADAHANNYTYLTNSSS